MTKAQLNRLEKIRQRWMGFEYKGQADYDVRFLLKLLLGKDPNYVEKADETNNSRK